MGGLLKILQEIGMFPQRILAKEILQEKIFSILPAKETLFLQIWEQQQAE